MHSGVALTARLGVLLVALHASNAHAEEPRAAAPVTADATEAARAHFKTGTKLYQDQNYAGALAEFEAAYAAKPGPGSLQNVALCQKALFRYGEAADSLTRLLTVHDAELSDAERVAAKRARDELEALVGTVRLVVSPPSAEVTLDGQALRAADRAAPLRLSVGEHTFVATAPGHTRVSANIHVASGQRDAIVDLTLIATTGFIDVRSADASAAIAIDGKPVAFGHFLAAVTPNDEHVVQIYKDGIAPFEARVSVPLGKTVVVSGQPGAPTTAPDPTAPPSAPSRSFEKPPLGWYIAGSASVLATAATPFRYDLSDATAGAWALGVRGGRRLKPAVAVAAHVEYAALHVRHACDQRASELQELPVSCGDTNAIPVSYSQSSLRFGPTLELMTTDARFRALGGIGFGAVWHQLNIEAESANGFDPYFSVEVGIGANTKHVLFALTAETIVDGTRGMIQGRTVGPPERREHETAFDRTGRTQAFVGLNLRVGYSEWSP